mgnify:CR=1 FL=1
MSALLPEGLEEEVADLDALADVLAEDWRTNPSNYAFVIASEGAKDAELTDAAPSPPVDQDATEDEVLAR